MKMIKLGPIKEVKSIKGFGPRYIEIKKTTCIQLRQDFENDDDEST